MEEKSHLKKLRKFIKLKLIGSLYLLSNRFIMIQKVTFDIPFNPY